MPQDADTDADLEKRVQCLDVKQAKAFGNNPLGNPDLWAHLLWVLITSEPLSIEVSYNDCVNLLERNVGGRLWETLEYGVAHEDFGQLRQYSAQPLSFIYGLIVNANSSPIPWCTIYSPLPACRHCIHAGTSFRCACLPYSSQALINRNGRRRCTHERRDLSIY